MSLHIETRPATPADYDFMRKVYFETQRWVIDQVFGWDEIREHNKFNYQFKPEQSQIIIADAQLVGWLQLDEQLRSIEVVGIYIASTHQQHGVGTALMLALLNRARMEDKEILFSAARMNQAKKLFEELGFHTADEHEDDHKFHIRYNH